MDINNKKIKINFNNNISETLLIPIYMRVLDAKSKKPILNDQNSISLVNKIDYDFSKFDNAFMSKIGVIKRIQFFDKLVFDFINTHQNPVIVQLGSGLDIRANRVQNRDKAKFYDLDLPDVIAIKEKLISSDYVENIPASFFDEGWMKILAKAYPVGDFLFVAEGVLMYFKEEDVKLLFNTLFKYFSNYTIAFDAISSFIFKRQNQHDTIKKVAARFNWAIDDINTINTWNSAFKVNFLGYIMDLMAKESFFVKIVKSLIPKARKSSIILAVEVAS